jgi:DNA invertase Pin-like site-specific DNA recombinase
VSVGPDAQMAHEERRALVLERMRRISSSSAELIGHSLELLEKAISSKSIDDVYSYLEAAGPMLLAAIEMLKAAR